MFYLALVTVLASAALAQERPLQPVVQGDVVAGPPRVYTFSAGPGDVVYGTCLLRGVNAATVVVFALYDAHGSKLKEAYCQGYDLEAPQPIGFVAPTRGAYQIRVRPIGKPGGSYVLSTKMQTPAQRVAGVAVTPTRRFESPRVSQLAKDVSLGQGGAVERFWPNAKAGGGPHVEKIKDDDRDFLVTFLWKETYETHNVLGARHKSGS
ncbi:MAG TPA: hypothetical protein VH639_27290 [Bryobacteraceae bacterium]|jgi:hypothetical protein